LLVLKNGFDKALQGSLLFFALCSMHAKSGRDRHIAVSRSCNNEGNGPLLAFYQGVLAAIPRLAKVRKLQDHPKRRVLPLLDSWFMLQD